ncbi:MAG TPA: PTS sugar transporter subunit IIA [Polyangiaceae bacterium]|nr:PTS sugar transporter subunit IIA [Polyangiaceae bacterium]
MRSKDEALRALADLLGTAAASPGSADFYRVLGERESLQSTGIGDGVAIPHGAIENIGGQVAALLLCPSGIPFDAIDDKPVYILFAVVTPKRATGEHLKTLARISRLLRDPAFRQKLLASRSRDEAFSLVRSAEEGRAA